MDQELKKLKNIIADTLNVDPDEIELNTTFADDLGADSLDLFQIVMGIEEEFGISVPQDIAENVNTVGEALSLIKNAQEGGE